ncbi:MAG: type 1 glutamine amidotransferase [Geminicoccaceae bacterium]|nr:type 1 glutamine amidotransferase [Geminicoccaceae bacterium]
MRIGILIAGHVPDELAPLHGDYGTMTARMLGRIDPALVFEHYLVVDGRFPEDPDACDAWLITGSRFGVYDPEPFIPRLEQFVRDCFVAGRKVVGICFGHQLIAHALGARVEKAEAGWGVGPHTYRTKDGSFTINAMHQDQVLEVPKGATVIARSDFCPIAALAYDDRALSFQGHPEFDNAYERDLVASRRTIRIPEEVADPALAAIGEAEQAPDALTVARRIVEFLKETPPGSDRATRGGSPGATRYRRSAADHRGTG